MAQLLVRNISESIVRSLKIQAALHGVSAEEEHRRILEAALGGRAEPSAFSFSQPVLLPEEPVRPEGTGGYLLRDEVLARPVNRVAVAEEGLSFKAHLLALGGLDVEDIEFERPRTYSKRRNLEL